MLFMILSLGEDRCEGENDKVFTRSALIESDLWRAGEEVKAKKENQLRRAYVRARKADCVKVLVADDRRARSGGGERKSRPFVRVCSRVLRKAFALPGDAVEWASRCAFSLLVRRAALWGRL